MGEYLRSNFGISDHWLLKAREEAITDNNIPIVLWAYGIITIKDLNKILDHQPCYCYDELKH